MHPGLLDLVRSVAEEVPVDESTAASAVEHRLVGATLAALHRGAATTTSTPIERSLAAYALDARARQARLRRALAVVDDVLSELGVGWLTFKGLAAQRQWYDEPGERFFTDLDILLAPHDLDRVEPILEALGPDYEHAALAQRLVRSGQLQHVAMRIVGSPTDIHFDFLKIGVPTRQARLVWSTAIEIEIDGIGAVRTPSPEIALVGLVMHQNKDAFAYLGSMVDVKRVIERETLDWERVRAFVAGEGLNVPFWCSLERIADVLGVETPDPPSLDRRKVAGWRRVWPDDVVLAGHETRRSAPVRQRWLPTFTDGRKMSVLREARRQLAPPPGLLTIAAHGADEHSYLRAVTLDRLRKRSRATATQ